MKRTTLAAAATLMASAFSAIAGPNFVAKIPLSGGSAIYEFYMERALLPECQNSSSHPSALIANLETPKGIIPYGTGCWVARVDGNIWIAVKSFDDGVVRETVIHNSKLKPPKSEAGPQSQFVKDLIKEVEEDYSSCKGVKRAKVGEQAGPCDSMDEAIMLLKREGYCMVKVRTTNPDNNWIKCP